MWLIDDGQPVNRESLYRLAGPGEETTMAKFHLKCAADGTHEVHGPDGRAGDMDGKELRDYAKMHLGMRDGEYTSLKMSERLAVNIGSGNSGSTALHHMVRDMQLSENCSEHDALTRVLQTEEGAAAWERKRQSELAESRTLSRFGK